MRAILCVARPAPAALGPPARGSAARPVTRTPFSGRPVARTSTPRGLASAPPPPPAALLRVPPPAQHARVAATLRQGDAADNAGRTSLHRYATAGDAAGLRRSLQQQGGFNVDEKDDNECTALHLAAMSGSEECIAELLAAGANPSATECRGITPLHFSVLLGSPAGTQALIAAGAPLEARVGDAFSVMQMDMRASTGLGDRPLHWAALRTAGPYTDGIGAHVELLLAAGADPNARNDCRCTPLIYAALGGRPELGGNAEAVRLLLAAGADSTVQDHDTGFTALHWAAFGGLTCAFALKALLDGGADPNARSPTGLTPLHVACQAAIPGYMDDMCVAALLRAGADPAAMEYQGVTPAHFAAVAGSAAAIQLLAEAGALVDSVTTVSASTVTAIRDDRGMVRRVAATGQGCTPLHWAAQAAQPEAVAALLAAGADPEARDALGRTALHHAAAGDAVERINASLPNTRRIPLGTNSNEPGFMEAALEWTGGSGTESRQAACVRSLLAAGADRGAREGSGLTPADLAARHNHTVCLKLLAGK